MNTVKLMNWLDGDDLFEPILFNDFLTKPMDWNMLLHQDDWKATLLMRLAQKTYLCTKRVLDRLFAIPEVRSSIHVRASMPTDAAINETTAFHQAVVNDNLWMMQALMAHSADASLCTSDGSNVLHMATVSSFHQLLVLLDYGVLKYCSCDLNAQTKVCQRTILHMLCDRDSCDDDLERLLQYLPADDYQLNPSIKDSTGKTAMDYVMANVEPGNKRSKALNYLLIMQQQYDQRPQRIFNLLQTTVYLVPQLSRYVVEYCG